MPCAAKVVERGVADTSIACRDYVIRRPTELRLEYSLLLRTLFFVTASPYTPVIWVVLVMQFQHRHPGWWIQWLYCSTVVHPAEGCSHSCRCFIYSPAHKLFSS